MEYDRSIFPRLTQTFQRYHCTPSRILDLGCGTGTMALLLAREGWEVTGIDTSEAMIMEARRKAADAGKDVRFIAGAMEEAHPDEIFPVAISLYDVLNHLNDEAALRASLCTVREVLETDGLLIFDVNNRRGYERLWGEDESIRHPDFTLTIKNSFDALQQRALSQVTIDFVNGNPSIVETIVQRHFLEKEIRRALAEARFRVLESRKFAFPAAPGVGKLKTWWVARAVSR